MGVRGLTTFMTSRRSCSETINIAGPGTAVIIDLMSFLFAVASLSLPRTRHNDDRDLWHFGGKLFNVDMMMTADFNRSVVLTTMTVDLLRFLGVSPEFVMDGSRGSGSAAERRGRHMTTSFRTRENGQRMARIANELEARAALGVNAGVVRLTNADKSLEEGVAPTTGLKDCLIDLVANKLRCPYIATCGEADRAIAEAMRSRNNGVRAPFKSTVPAVLGVLSNDTDFAVMNGSKLVFISEFFDAIGPILANADRTSETTWDWALAFERLATAREVHVAGYGPKRLAQTLGISPVSRLADLTILLGNDFTNKDRAMIRLPGSGPFIERAANCIKNSASVNHLSCLGRHDAAYHQCIADTMGFYGYHPNTSDAPSLDLAEYATECHRVYDDLGPRVVLDNPDTEQLLRQLIFRNVLSPFFGAACPPCPKSAVPRHPDPVEDAILHGGFWISSLFYGSTIWDPEYLEWRRSLWQVVCDGAENRIIESLVEYGHDDTYIKLRPTVVRFGSRQGLALRDVLVDRPFQFRLGQLENFLLPILGPSKWTNITNAAEVVWLHWMHTAAGIKSHGIQGDELKALVVTTVLGAGVLKKQKFGTALFPVVSEAKIAELGKILGQGSGDFFCLLRRCLWDTASQLSATEKTFSSSLSPVGRQPLFLVEWILMTHRYMSWTSSLIIFANQSDESINEAKWIINIGDVFSGMLYFLVLLAVSEPLAIKESGKTHYLILLKNNFQFVVSRVLYDRVVSNIRGVINSIAEDCEEVTRKISRDGKDLSIL